MVLTLAQIQNNSDMTVTTAKCFRLYGRLIIKKRVLLLHIQFLTQCKRRGLIPKFVHISSASHSEASEKAIKYAKNKWLLEEIKCKHKELSKLEEHLYVLHFKLLKLVDHHCAAECVVLGCVEGKKDCWQIVMTRIDQNLSQRMRQIKQKHSKKLRSLASAQTSTAKPRLAPKAIDNFVINLSSEVFSQAELNLLNKGLNYALLPASAPLDEIVNSFETTIQYSEHSSRSAARHDMKKCLLRAASSIKNSNKRNKFSDWSTVRKLKARNVIYSRADKGNAVVIMSKEDYDCRVLDMISAGPYEENKFKNGKSRDPLYIMTEEANSTRQKIARLMGEEKLERKLLVTNPKVASLYCLPKVHKNPLAMRPISSNICTPTEKMAAWLVEELKKYPIKHGRSIKNSIELAEQIKDLNLRRGEIIVSFDVTALFPSVPIDDALRCLQNHLERNRAPPNHIEAYMSTAKLCMEQNFFAFRNKFYRQTFGLSMGSKLSPIMAELFMSNFEVEMEKQKIFPRVWKRYVDDIFAVVKERYLSQTLNWLNSRHQSIKFTVEQEVDGKIPFLDLLVQRKENGNLTFGIYRKPTSTDRYITCDSNHFGAQKQAAFHSMAHRLVSVPMEKEEYDAEKTYIHKAAELNGYHSQFVEKIIGKHERRKFRRNCTTLQPEKSDLKRMSLPFFPKITNQIKNFLHKHNIQVVYKSGNTLRDLLGNLKDKIPPDELSGIYEIKCKQCPEVYIGQSRRKFKVRLREHKNAVQTGKINDSSVALHAVTNQHEIDWENSKLIKHVQKATHLNSWESMFITIANQPLMNENDAPISSPLFHLTKLRV